MMKFAMAMFDLLAAKTPLTTGYELLFDAKNFTFLHLAKINLGYLKKIMLYLQVTAHTVYNYNHTHFMKIFILKKRIKKNKRVIVEN